MEETGISHVPPARPGRSRIARRIMALVAVAVVTAVFTSTSIFVWREVEQEVTTRREGLEATGYVFASAIADHLVSGNRGETLKVLRSMSRIPRISFTAVVNSQGKPLASMGSAVLLDGKNATNDGGTIDLLTSGALPVSVDIIKGGEPVGRLVIIADISDLLRDILSMLAMMAISGILAGLAGMALAARLVRRVSQPIVSLTETMRRVRDTSDYTARVEHQSNDETGMLVDAFNSMLSEIRARDQALEHHRKTLEETVERRTHELSVAKDAAEAANRTKSGFLATMSHEIRTPMNGVMVMAELLAGAGLDRRLQRYAEVIVKSGQTLLAIINDILDLSKIEAGKLSLERIDVDPVEIADDVISLYWERALSKGLGLAARVAPGVPLRILGDPVRLNQILSNLVNNALKFTERGHVLLSIYHDGKRLHIAVSDTGIGIPPEKIGALFAAFSQADQSTTRKFGGTGLGLTICQKLAQAMGGQIAVTSQVGKGSTFTVSIPVVVVRPRPAPVPPQPGRSRVGLAIDGQATMACLGTALMGAGYQTARAAQGQADFDVIFASPARLEGLQLPKGKRPTIICIAEFGEGGGETALADGSADDIIRCPLRHSDIEEVLLRLQSGEKAGPQANRAMAAGSAPRTSFVGRRILIVDDNAVNREVVIEVLRQLDITVETAVNGQEAIDKWSKRRFDLVFMDCAMPGMDGYTATREIRAREVLDPKSTRVPIVALTAQAAGIAADEWQNAGMDDYLTKPFTMRSIVNCLERQFSGRPLAAPTPNAKDEVSELPVIDDTVIAELRTIGGSDALFQRVLRLFASNVPKAVLEIADLSEGKDSANADDLIALADAVHALKSMCANIGAKRAQQACHQLEYLARTGQPFDVGEHVALIVGEVRSALAAVDLLRTA